MAQAADTLIEWSLDNYVAHLIATSGCERYPALWEMWERIATKRLLFIRQRLVDGKPYNPADGKPYNPEVVNHSNFRSNYTFDFDDRDRVKVNSRDWFDYRYTVAEPRQPPTDVSQNKLGAPPEHDWDDYKQKFQQLWQEKGDFELPKDQVEGWNSQAAAARTLLDYIQTRVEAGKVPHEKTVENYISRWADKLRMAVERN